MREVEGERDVNEDGTRLLHGSFNIDDTFLYCNTFCFYGVLSRILITVCVVFVSQHQRTVPTRGRRQYKRASRVAGSHRVAAGQVQHKVSSGGGQVLLITSSEGGQVMQDVSSAEGQVNKNVS